MDRAVLSAVTLVMVVAACAGDSGDEVGDTGARPASTPTEEPTDPESVAIADLSASTGVDPAEIEVVRHDDVTWRNGSMGCPEPGESYTQALVDGYRLVLRAAGVEYFYHGATGSRRSAATIRTPAAPSTRAPRALVKAVTRACRPTLRRRTT